MKSIKEIEKKIVPILRKNKVKRAGIFGSYARGKQKKNSDIDILVELDERWDLFDVIGLKLTLEKTLNKSKFPFSMRFLQPSSHIRRQTQ